MRLWLGHLPALAVEAFPVKPPVQGTGPYTMGSSSVPGIVPGSTHLISSGPHSTIVILILLSPFCRCRH
jgi:hypothetical protein